jgi:hypothetical protein
MLGGVPSMLRSRATASLLRIHFLVVAFDPNFGP